ncbi:MAG: hypothetical protein WCX65_01320 [bacterium]
MTAALNPKKAPAYIRPNVPKELSPYKPGRPLIKINAVMMMPPAIRERTDPITGFFIDLESAIKQEAIYIAGANTKIRLKSS